MNEASDHDLDDSMDRFEAASMASAIDLPPIQCDQILLALDGSNQDQLAREIAEQFQASIKTADLDGEAHPHRLILEQGRQCDLVVAPAPFREDFAELGAASIGSNLDRLLCKREFPLLVVRDPDRAVSDLCREIVLPLSFVAEDDSRAAAWAFRALAPDGRLRLLAVVDTDRLIRERKIEGDPRELENLDEAELAGLDQPETAGFIAAVQRRAAEENVGCRVSIRVGSTVPATARFANLQPCLVVVACPRNETDPTYADVHALIRQSLNPVLVV